MSRTKTQMVLRAAALAFVLAWLFVDELRGLVPFWLPFVVLLATEVEFVLRGRLEPRRPARRRIAPGPEDADLGFGELVEDEEGYRYVPPPQRERRGKGRMVAWAVGVVAGVALFALAARADRASTWQSLDAGARRQSVARLTSEAAIIAGRPVTLRCDENYSFTGSGSDTLGIAFPRAGITFLDPAVCRTLHDLLTDGDEHRDTGEALVVLAHEAIHLGGERREGVTECLALQAAVPLAVRLGIEEQRARRILGAELDRRLAERSVVRAAYALPRSCRDGGALDRRPDDPRFP
ncbi:MAG TPA: hypothetical protein VFN99_05200 [Gaiella sp.]|nr:hypothetical protein [Gaiella sp.]